ncbi:MAG TPA: polysaccharide deacetylase family protein [Chloroflexota bacterium]|jgi:peptidoglycan/xylan/chitin deacetylase (PgdA/CDA1 family)
MGRLVDWLSEPRAPHHAITWWRRARRYRDLPRRRPDETSLTLALSFDVERDPGQPVDPHRCQTCFPFLNWLEAVSLARDWRTTLFVQGSIVEQLAAPLRRLVPRHELGLHGYFHELWGRQLWFAPYEPSPAPGLRRALLEEGLRAFERAGLPRPRAFRAPNLVCDQTTLALLEQAGFRLDSSAAAYRGEAPIVSRHGALVRVPVSGAPRPILHRWRGTPLPSWAIHRVVNLENFLAPPDELMPLVEEVLAVQTLAGSPHHLVVLAHPWEFADLPITGCGSANYDRLIERVELLSSYFPTTVSGISDIVSRSALGHVDRPAAS